MSELSLFLKENKKKKVNGLFPATKSLCDKNGEPLMWEFKPITTKESEEIRDECMIQKLLPGQNNKTELRLDVKKYIARLTCACVINPDLDSAELQDSYGVKTPEALLQEMIDDPGEYDTFTSYVFNYNGFDDIDDLKNNAKN